MKKILMLLSLVFVAVSQAKADSSVGCGLGSLIFKDNTLVSSTLRVTTNNMFLTQYLGVTSGTSGCTRHSIVMNEKAHIHFAEVNLEKLSEEMAKGKGLYLNAFAFTLGCKEGMENELGQITRSNYESLFPSENTDAAEMMKNLGPALRSNKNLNKNCKKASLI